MKSNPANITVDIHDLTTGYSTSRRHAVITDGINASLRAGELTCLLGPNGAGKSTLLKTLSGFLAPLSGDILIDGRRLSDYTPNDLARVIGVVLTDRITLDNMTVHELVSMGRSPYTGFWGRLTDTDLDIVDQAIGTVGITPLALRTIHTLSDGERQKVMIAKALAQQTPIIFLDEPTAFLDYPSKVDIMQLLRRLARDQGKTVFLSTHDLELALQIADKIWLIDRPHGVVTGTPEDLSLCGDLARYFESEGVAFDMASGLFQIANRPTRLMRLTGSPDDPRYSMVRKALSRNGIGTTDSDGTPTGGHIVITPDAYIIDGIHRCATIADMLSLITTGA